MNLILTMAGKYNRFKVGGYKVPKYLLPWRRHTILAEILEHVGHRATNVYLVANKADVEYRPHVLDTLESFYGCSQNNLIYIDDTCGQAHTAHIALKKIGLSKLNNDPVLFHNIDTILYNRNFIDIREQLADNSGYIDVFESNNHQYSYVLVNEHGFVFEIAEKIVISNMATSGMYGFKTAELFNWYYSGQQYISDIYKKMINEGLSVRTGKLHDEKDTWVLGTPEEYMNMTRRLR